MGRSTQGVKLANLKESDRLLAVQKVEGDSEVMQEEISNSPVEVTTDEAAPEGD